MNTIFPSETQLPVSWSDDSDWYAHRREPLVTLDYTSWHTYVVYPSPAFISEHGEGR